MITVLEKAIVTNGTLGVDPLGNLFLTCAFVDCAITFPPGAKSFQPVFFSCAFTRCTFKDVPEWALKDCHIEPSEGG